MEHAWEQGEKRNKTGKWQVPQTQEGYDTQWSVDYGLGEDAGEGRNMVTDINGARGCGAVIGPDDAIRGLARGAAKDGYPDCCGRRAVKEGIFRLRLDDGSVLTCYRCGLHGGQSAGSSPVPDCKCPGCSTGSQYHTERNPTGGKPDVWRYCGPKHKAADAPRVALFEKIRNKLGKDDPDVQAKLTALNTKQQPTTPAEALAQLKNILAAGTLQAVQDALDAGPSGAGDA